MKKLIYIAYTLLLIGFASYCTAENNTPPFKVGDHVQVVRYDLDPMIIGDKGIVTSVSYPDDYYRVNIDKIGELYFRSYEIKKINY